MESITDHEEPSMVDIHETTQIKYLTIKIGSSSDNNNGDKSNPISPAISISPHLNSPSPPSSAFVSALQSPYISPRALEPPLKPPPSPPPPPVQQIASITPIVVETSTNPTTTLPSPTSYSDDIPSSSYTPPSERYDFSDAARVSFSFPVPRVSFTKNTVSPSSNAKLRSCDVYIGYHGQNLNLIRFCKWLKSELELQGIASFVADRAKYSDSPSHEIADRIICSAAFGVVVANSSSFRNPFSIEEIRLFAQKKNLIPLLFDIDANEVTKLHDDISEDKECKEAAEGFARCNEFKIEANESNWRSCISKTVSILTSKLARKNIVEKDFNGVELPFHRNKLFVGREKEIAEIESAFFGFSDAHELENSKPAIAGCGNTGSSDGFADEESDAAKSNGRFISLEMWKSKEPTLEAWIDPVIELSSKGRNLQRQRSKHKKSRSGGNKNCNNGGVICINGGSGLGKTELALEFAYRYSQRYKMVLWIGGEARYFRQNILNLSVNLGLDVTAEAEKERGRVRSFDEQEFDAFQRVKRELFRDLPYLIIIDDLETEREWWEGKDLHDLIPRNTGATNVIITTRLSKVMNFEPFQLQPLAPTDSIVLLRGRKKKDYPMQELEVLRKFDDRLNRLSFGLWVVGSLLSELNISPSALFEAIDRISVGVNSVSIGSADDQFWLNNSFLMKVMVFAYSLLDRASNIKSLAPKMALAGAWLAPAPVSSNLLASAAYKIPTKSSKFGRWKKCLSCLSPQARKNEVESAAALVKLGLAKKSTKQPGYWIQFHPISQLFARRRGGLLPAKATVLGVRKLGNPSLNSDHLWASAFLVFGFKSEPPLVQLKSIDMVLFIKKTALPLAVRSFAAFSRCNSALELLKVCTNVLEEVEKSFASQIQDWQHGSFCWSKNEKSRRVDEFEWQDVTLLKATLLETRAKLLMRGGNFDSGEDLCRTCISIRTVMLGHNHPQTLAAQETLAKLVRFRSKI